MSIFFGEKIKLVLKSHEKKSHDVVTDPLCITKEIQIIHRLFLVIAVCC